MIEDLAKLEHLQWMEWSKSMAKFLLSVRNSSNFKEIDDKLKVWENLWVDYASLSENEKEKDREWASRVINLINKED